MLYYISSSNPILWRTSYTVFTFYPIQFIYYNFIYLITFALNCFPCRVTLSMSLCMLWGTSLNTPTPPNISWYSWQTRTTWPSTTASDPSGSSDGQYVFGAFPKKLIRKCWNASLFFFYSECEESQSSELFFFYKW